MRIVYVDEDTQCLKAEAEKAEGGSQDSKSGIRVMGVSPDGQHLAAGDRNGNLRLDAIIYEYGVHALTGP